MSREEKRRLKASLCMKGLIVLLGMTGQVLGLFRASFMRGALFLYYTNLSNCWMILLSLALFILDAVQLTGRRETPWPAWISSLRFSLVSGILLTFVGFSLLLAPMMDRSYLVSPDNLLVHNLVPLLSAADYLLYDAGTAPRKPSVLYGLIMPFLYLGLVMAVSQMGSFFYGGTRRFPYFFVDVDANGWFALGDGKLGVAYWIVILSLVTLAISRALQGLKRLADRRQQGS